MLDPAVELLRRGLEQLGLPLRSVEVELGPSQCEFTFRPQAGLDSADTMVLFRAAVKQIARRHGYLASFMCRPALPNVMSSGWHLHQSLIETQVATQRLCVRSPRRLSTVGKIFSRRAARPCARRGRLHHADHQRLQALPAYSLAPDRAIWARDNRGAMVRVLGQPGDAATRLENRVGEPAANPYLYVASQIYAGLDGIARRLDPGPSADTPYEAVAALLPKNLGEAMTALRADEMFRAGLRRGFCRLLHAYQGGRARTLPERNATSSRTPTPWEQKNIWIYFEALDSRARGARSRARLMRQKPTVPAMPTIAQMSLIFAGTPAPNDAA